MPQRWAELDQMLPEGPESSAPLRPGPPLILAAWSHATPALKRARLAQHVRWAAQQGALQSVSAFLRNLDASDWYYLPG